MIDDHAPPAHDPETSSEEIIEPRSEGEASGDDARGDDAGDHDLVSAPSAFPSPAPLIPNDAGPLLGLTSTTTEKAGLISGNDEDSNPPPCYAPLLGTNNAEHTEKLGKSSQRRSPKHACYGKLLRDSGPSSPRKCQKTAVLERSGCYGKVGRQRAASSKGQIVIDVTPTAAGFGLCFNR